MKDRNRTVIVIYGYPITIEGTGRPDGARKWSYRIEGDGGTIVGSGAGFGAYREARAAAVASIEASGGPPGRPTQTGRPTQKGRSG